MSLNIKDILAIDGGLSFIQSRWPQTVGAETNARARFKLRDGEKTPSGAMKQTQDGVWIVTDFGGDGKGRNAVDLLMHLEGKEFVEALKTVAAHYDIGDAPTVAKPDYNKWPAKPDEIEGSTTHQPKEVTMDEVKCVLTDSAWKALGKDDVSRLDEARKLFAKYHLKSLEWKRHTSKGVTHEFRSNERYPIFVYEEVHPDTKQIFGRYYEPKAEKKDRFRYFGEKPRTYIHGIEQAQRRVQAMQENLRNDLERAGNKEQHEIDAEVDKLKLDEILICSGGSDALNAAACGFEVVWRNSESEPWTPQDVKQLRALAHVIINVPDIDATGIREAHKLALQYLDIHTVWLPEYIATRRGANGNPLNKDLRDYLRAPKPSITSVGHLTFAGGESTVASNSAHTAKDFKELVRTAMPYEFWDEDFKLSKKGEPIRRHGRIVKTYQPRQERMFNFLYRCGFCRLVSEKGKDGRLFVYIHGNIVHELESPVVIREFVKNFLKSRHANEDLMDAFNKTPLLSDTALEGLEVKQLDFKHFGPGFQYFFFHGKVWKVTKDGIEEMSPMASGKYVWADKVLSLEKMSDRSKPNLRHTMPTVLEPFFRTETLPTGEVLVRVINQESHFLKYLMQTCRVHWRTELEERLNFLQRYRTEEDRAAYFQAYHIDEETQKQIYYWSASDARREEYRAKYHVSLEGPVLTRSEIDEQCGHLANRLYCIGYALYRQKVVSQPWAVWVMDYKVVEEQKAHGGTGKSIITKALGVFQRQLPVDGRSENTQKNDFILEDVTKDTDLILVDDAGPYYKFDRHYEHLTSDLVANRKNMKAIKLSYDESPKWWFNSNFGDRFTNPSDLRRKIYMVVSDYYHKNNGDYDSDCSPKSDLGLDLMIDFDEHQWNLFYNLFAQALQFHLSQKDPVLAPGHNITMRNLIALMGDNFRAWADVFFDKNSGKLDVEISRQEAYEDYLKNNTRITPQAWKTKLEAWVQFNYYTLNPASRCTSNRRIIRNIEGRTMEMIYIATQESNADIEDEPSW